MIHAARFVGMNSVTERVRRSERSNQSLRFFYVRILFVVTALAVSVRCRSIVRCRLATYRMQAAMTSVDHNPTRKRGIDPSFTRRVMIHAVRFVGMNGVTELVSPGYFPAPKRSGK